MQQLLYAVLGEDAGWGLVTLEFISWLCHGLPRAFFGFFLSINYFGSYGVARFHGRLVGWDCGHSVFAF